MAKQPSATGVVRYIGDGAYLFGVPARDLTPEEWSQHKALILTSPQAREMYDIPTEDAPAIEPAKEQ
jgi:hypothetical protein